MKVSLNVVKRFVDVDLSVDELVQKINQQLGQVEEVVDLAPKYKDVVIANVVACEKHPDADKLSVCLIDDGGVVADVPRNEQGYVEVVCGAPNVRAGLFVAWLPPKSTVPASFGDAEPFVLEARELRGIVSQGMLAAADELALGSDHDGIVELTDADLPPLGEVMTLAPGQSFAELFGLNDTIIDIENKMFTHRPDLFGQLGVAREIAAILQGVPAKGDDAKDTRFTNPDWYWSKPSFPVGDDSLELNVVNQAQDKVPRLMVVAMSGVTVQPSPLWLQIELVRLGCKAINSIVDATNYAMLLTAQPTHAYDYDKLRGAYLGARMASAGERCTLLNGKTYELNEADIVIVDGEGVIGLGGVMGGGNSEVSAETKNIVLECASFDMYAVRKTSMRYGIFTDAVTRFTKGQSPLQNDRVLAWLMGVVSQLSGARQASAVADLPGRDDVTTKSSLSGEIAVSARFINERLGSDLATTQISGLLRSANFASYPTENDPDAIFVTAPFWRTDIELPEDIVEEVGRLYGFDKLPRELPQRSIKPVARNPIFEMKRTVRSELSRAGANEVLTYSFVHENTLKKAAQNPVEAYKLGNALSPDLQYYRLSVLPSLLDKVHANIKTGHDEFALFEFGKAHRKGDNDDEDLPREYGRLSLVYAAKKSNATAYFMARRYLDVIAPEVDFVPLATCTLVNEHAVFAELAKPFEPQRSAVLMHGEKPVGIIGEFRSVVRDKFKLPLCSAGFELFQSYLLRRESKTYTQLSRYPGITQDISLRMPTTMRQSDVLYAANEALRALQPVASQTDLTAIDTYQPTGADKKHITFRLTITSYEKTLSDQEVATLTDAIAQAVAQKLGTERVM